MDGMLVGCRVTPRILLGFRNRQLLAVSHIIMYVICSIPLPYLSGTPDIVGGNPLPAGTGWTIPAGRGGPVYWGTLIS